MKFQTAGKSGNPVIVMLTGSFCPGAGLMYLYEKLKDAYYIILPEYNGHYENSTFTTRQREAGEIADYLTRHGLRQIRMIYGQSMGAEVGIELYRQMLERKMTVDHCFLDGAPCIKLPSFYKKFMYFKFQKMISMMKEKNVEEVLKGKLIQKISGGDSESLRPMLEPLAAMSSILSKETIKNETECCYTFDFPAFDKTAQQKMHFFYGSEEKAYKRCSAGVKKAYPLAESIVDGYGHLAYSMKNTEDYVKKMREICEK